MTHGDKSIKEREIMKGRRENHKRVTMNNKRHPTERPRRHEETVRGEGSRHHNEDLMLMRGVKTQDRQIRMVSGGGGDETRGSCYCLSPCWQLLYGQKGGNANL